MFLRIALRPSVYLVTIHFLFHLSAFVALLFTSAPLWLHLLFVVIIAGSGVRSVFFRTNAFAIIFTESSIFLVMTGRTVECILESEFHCTEWLQVLIFREVVAGQEREIAFTALSKFHVFVTPDSANAQHRRQLRALLRWYHFSRDMLHR